VDPVSDPLLEAPGIESGTSGLVATEPAHYVRNDNAVT
jgi:hypothetical protein